MRAAGMKITPAILIVMELSLIDGADPDSLYMPAITIANKPIADKIIVRWIQYFMEAHDLVIRKQTGKLSVSPEKQLHIEKAFAYHLGNLKRQFDAKELDEDLVLNADETHFVFNMDNGRRIGLRGDKNVKYVDFVSGEEAITMMVLITGGRNARLEIPMLIFKNDGRSYHIRGVPDDVPGVTYRSLPKAWMNNLFFQEWLSERRIVKGDRYGGKKTLFVDNCKGQNETEGVNEKLAAINTELCKLPANATDLVQPVKLAADAVREVNEQRDRYNISYARKAMIKTGMALNVNGLWEESQLFDELQAIIAKHRDHFSRKPISDE